MQLVTEKSPLTPGTPPLPMGVEISDTQRGKAAVDHHQQRLWMSCPSTLLLLLLLLLLFQ